MHGISMPFYGIYVAFYGIFVPSGGWFWGVWKIPILLGHGPFLSCIRGMSMAFCGISLAILWPLPTHSAFFDTNGINYIRIKMS